MVEPEEITAEEWKKIVKDLNDLGYGVIIEMEEETEE